MRVSDIQIGSLYCFPEHKIAVCIYADAKSDCYAKRVFAMQKGTPFVALEAINLNDLYMFKDKDLFRLKVLLTSGEIGWLVLDNARGNIMMEKYRYE